MKFESSICVLLRVGSKMKVFGKVNGDFGFFVLGCDFSSGFCLVIGNFFFSNSCGFFIFFIGFGFLWFGDVFEM